MNNELLNKMQEIAQGQQFDPEKVNGELFEELVPASGKSNTLAGEILRATNRIIYRWWNDGDKAGVRYGKETVNPAVRFLYNIIKSGDIKAVDDLMDLVNYGDRVSDKEYDIILKNLLHDIIVYIAEKELWDVPNNKDMFEFANKDEDVDDWGEDDY